MKWICRACKHEYEAPEHKIGTPLPECPKCGGKNFPHVPVQYPTGDKDFSTNNIRSRQEVNNKVVDRDKYDLGEKPVIRKPKIRVINKGDKY